MSDSSYWKLSFQPADGKLLNIIQIRDITWDYYRIIKFVNSTKQAMLDPFVDGQVRDGKISYGLSSYGYDIRVADEFKIFTNIHTTVVDPKQFDVHSMVDFKGEVCIIPPNSFALARTVEYFHIPRGVLTNCVGKSTYARCGIIVMSPLSNRSGRVMPPLKSPITLPCQPRSMLMKELHKCSFLKEMEFAKYLMPIKRQYQAQQSIVLPKL
jgi:dCTP deaminase